MELLFTAILMMAYMVWDNSPTPQLATVATTFRDNAMSWTNETARVMRARVESTVSKATLLMSVTSTAAQGGSMQQRRVGQYVHEVVGTLGKETVRSYNLDSHLQTDFATEVMYKSKAYLHAILQDVLVQQGGGKYALRIFPIIAGEDADEYTNQVKKIAAKATISYTTDSAVVVIWVFGLDNKQLSWLDVPGIKFKNSSKMAKRLAMMGTSSYLFGRFNLVITDGAMAYRKGTLSARLYEVSEEQLPYEDGRSYIRKEFVDHLVSKMAKRLQAEGRSEDYINRKVDQVSGRAFNIRALLPDALLKGDVIVVDDLDVDMLIPTENFKSEVHGTVDGSVLLQMFTQEQWGAVRANRQTVSLFYDNLFAIRTPGRKNSKGLIKDALTDVMDRYFDSVQAGKPIFTTKVDDLAPSQLKNMQVRLQRFFGLTGSLNESFYLTQRNAQSVVNMMTPKHSHKQDDRIQDYPVPFALRSSIRAEVDYERVYGMEAPNGINEVAFTPFGAILPDTISLAGEVVKAATGLLLRVFGGADWDDHAEFHIRRASQDSELFGVKKNDIVAFIARNPIGVSSDGTNVYAEYYVLKVAQSSVSMLLHEFNLKSAAGLPSLSFDGLIPSIVEMPEMTPSWTPGQSDVPSAYEIGQVYATIDAVRDAVGVYGVHSNQMMAAGRHRFPFTFVAPEESFVDAAQQTRLPEDLAFIGSHNEAFKGWLTSSNIIFDKWEARRLGFFDNETKQFTVPVEDGVFSDLVEFHTHLVDIFTASSVEHIKGLVPVHRERAEAFGYNKFPYVLTKLREEENRIMREIGDRDLYFAEHQSDASDWVIHRMSQAVKDGNLTKSRAREMLMEAFVNHVRNLSNTSGTWPYSNGDRLLYHGRMFDMLLKVIEEAQEAGSWFPLSLFGQSE